MVDELETIGVNEVSVPEYYYKVILDYIEPELKGIGFILPNQKEMGLLKSYVVSIDEVEKFTNIDFFPSLPDATEDQLEGKIDLSKWNFSK